jgi:hypothetical protein
MDGGGFRMTDFSSDPHRQGAPWETAILIVGVFALATATLAAWRASAELRGRRMEVARLDRETAQARARAGLLEGRQGTAAAALAAQAAGTLDAPPPRVVAELSAAMPPDVRLESLDLDYRDRILVVLRVRARSPEAYDRFLEGLSRSTRFREIVPGPEGRDGELSASVRASYRYGVAE